MYSTEGIPSTGTSDTSKMGKKKGGLEGSSTGGTEKASQTGKSMKGAAGEKLGQMNK
jgi:hypothetical protein